MRWTKERNWKMKMKVEFIIHYNMLMLDKKFENLSEIFFTNCLIYQFSIKLLYRIESHFRLFSRITIYIIGTFCYYHYFVVLASQLIKEKTERVYVEPNRIIWINSMKKSNNGKLQLQANKQIIACKFYDSAAFKVTVCSSLSLKRFTAWSVETRENTIKMTGIVYVMRIINTSTVFLLFLASLCANAFNTLPNLLPKVS